MTSPVENSKPPAVLDLFKMAALAVTYVIVAKLSLSIGAIGGVAAPVWPPTGLALAALLIWGDRFWPGIAIGASVVNWLIGVPLLAAFAIGLGNTLEALIGCYLLRRADFRPSLERLRDVINLMVLAAGLSTMLSATIGVTSSRLAGLVSAAQYGTAWGTWWVGDAMGDLVVASTLMVWSTSPRLTRKSARLVEAGLLAALLILVAAWAFGSTSGIAGFAHPGAYVVFPFVIWAALRFGQRGAATTVSVIAAIAFWATVRGLGPFTSAQIHHSLVLLQTFIAVVAATALVLGAVITEARQATADLRDSEERYRRLIEISPDAVALTALNGTILLCNEQAAAVQGYTREELTGRNLLDSLVPEDRPRAAENMRKTLISSSVRNVEYTVCRKDGTQFPVELSTSVLFDAQRAPQGLIAVGRDISTRKQFESAAPQLAAIVASSYDAIIGKTLDGIITTWNAAAEQMYGYSQAEIIGRSISVLTPPDREGELADILARVRHGEQIQDHETVRSRKDGSPVQVSLTVSPIRDANGTIMGASTIARDISDRKALERLRADFISSLTHDIRGPIGNIANYLELLRDENGLSAKGQQIVTAMQSSVRKIFSLITNYLDGARIEAGRLTLTKGPVRLNELLSRVAREYELVAARRTITIDLRLHDALPALHADALALERVFANLIDNAIKFTPEGGRITVATALDQGAVAASVTDTGPGILPDEIPLLFERYQRSSSARRQFGTGLGLFIVKSLIDAHGGRIHVDSNHAGSCFTVLLPLPHATLSAPRL